MELEFILANFNLKIVTTINTNSFNFIYLNRIHLWLKRNDFKLDISFFFFLVKIIELNKFDLILSAQRASDEIFWMEKLSNSMRSQITMFTLTSYRYSNLLWINYFVFFLLLL